MAGAVFFLKKLLGAFQPERYQIVGALEGEIRLVGHIDLGEITEPAAPSADTGRLFVKDNGAGKSQLCVRFAGGATQVIATEPP